MSRNFRDSSDYRPFSRKFLPWKIPNSKFAKVFVAKLQKVFRLPSSFSFNFFLFCFSPATISTIPLDPNTLYLYVVCFAVIPCCKCYIVSIHVKFLGIAGLLWVSVFHLRGFRDLAVAELSEKRRSAACNLGIGANVFHPDQLHNEYLEAVKNDNDEWGFDIIVECTGSSKAIEQQFLYTRKGRSISYRLFIFTYSLIR